MTEHRGSLAETARALVADGRGILAADQSKATMTKRLESVGAESSRYTEGPAQALVA